MFQNATSLKSRQVTIVLANWLGQIGKPHMFASSHVNCVDTTLSVAAEHGALINGRCIPEIFADFGNCGPVVVSRVPQVLLHIMVVGSLKKKTKKTRETSP